MRLELIVRSGKHSGKVLQLSTDEILIGREDDCQLKSSSSDVSRHHCKLTNRDGRVVIEDLESQNGTFVNEQKLVSKQVLQSGDIIRVAKMEFQVRLRPSETPVSPSSPPKAVEDNISDWLKDVPPDVTKQDTTVMMDARQGTEKTQVRPAPKAVEIDPIVQQAAEIIRQYWKKRNS